MTTRRKKDELPKMYEAKKRNHILSGNPVGSSGGQILR